MRKISVLVIPVIFWFGIISAQTDSTMVRPFHLGIVYPISTNGIDAPKIANKVAVHAFMGLSKGVEGADLAGFMTTTNGNVKGMQAAGFANITSGNVNGIQVSGFFNTSASCNGLQGAGFMNVSQNVESLQAAGFMNVANNINGLQGAGFMNVAHDYNGLQAAGFMNTARNGKGLQAAGFMNISQEVKGSQIAGFINIAQKVKGVQIGFINIADSSDNPIGIINIIRNGRHDIALSVDELATIKMSYRSGGRKVYGIIGFGANGWEESVRYNLHYGIGLRNKLTNNFSLNIEALTDNYHHTNFDRDSKMKFNNTLVESLKLLAVFEPTKHVSFYVGPSVVLMLTNNSKAYNIPQYWFWQKTYTNNNYEFLKAYIGGVVGIQYTL